MNKVFRNVLLVLGVAAFSSVVAGATATYVLKRNKVSEPFLFSRSNAEGSVVTRTSYPTMITGTPVDLTEAAERSLHAVVHIKSTKTNNMSEGGEREFSPNDLFEFFFGEGIRRHQRLEPKSVLGFGSGVIISTDGYIVTNNHVIEGADELTIKLNDNREYKGKIIGQDSSSDLALIKIDASDMPAIKIGDSDNLKVGEWVLAVGNPFNLTSTVTAGIISAKARTLGVYSGGIESFIQTDAAINRGNSGGALVNSAGELVGINSVLSSPNGTYTGYGFAIPTNIMMKVVSDLKQYGTVQRAVLGIKGADLINDIYSNELSDKAKELGVTRGVLISEMIEGSSSAQSGLKKDDVIVGIGDEEVNSMANLHAILAKKKPGDKVQVRVIREKKEQTISVVLKNMKGTTAVLKEIDMDVLGAELEEPSNEVKKQLNISNGLQIKKMKKGKLSNSGVKEGFVILKANDHLIRTKKDFEAVVKDASNRHNAVVFIIGKYPNGKYAYFAVNLAED